MNCSKIDLHLPGYLSHELDPATAEEIERHISGCSSCSAKLQAERSLAEGLIALGVCPVPQETERALHERLDGIRGTERQGYRFLRAWAVAGALVAMIMVAGLLFSRQEPVTAAEVLSHARAAANRYKSWHIVYRIREHLRGGKSFVNSYEEWYRAPDMLTDYEKYPGQELTLAVCGSVRMIYDSSQNTARLWPMTKDEQHEIATRKITISVEPKVDLPSLKNPHLAGTIVIRGKTCDVVEGTYVGWKSKMSTKISYAVDRETGLVMRRTIGSGPQVNGNMVRDTVSWELDKPMADSVFGIRIPKGASVLKGKVGVPRSYPKMLLPASRAQEMLRNDMEWILERCPNGGIRVFYAPAQVPESYMFNWAGPSSVVDGRCTAVQVSYIKPSTGDTIVLEQRLSKPDEQGDAITEGSFSGRIFTGTVPYRYAVLTWQKDKFYFTMTASSLATPELIRVAESLQLVVNRYGGSVQPRQTQTYPPATESATVSGPKPVSHAGTLEFYYLKDISTASNPRGRWRMYSYPGAGAGYSFTGPTGKIIGSNAQPKQLLDEVVQPAKNKPILTSRDILATAVATATPDQYTKGETAVKVDVALTPAGAKKLAEFTRTHTGEILAIFYRGRLLMAPMIKDTIVGGKVAITGLRDMREAKGLVDAINSDRTSKPPNSGIRQLPRSR